MAVASVASQATGLLPAQIALSQPELVSQILLALGLDVRSIGFCLRINRLWCSEGGYSQAVWSSCNPRSGASPICHLSAASSEHLWKRLAEQRWPEETLVVAPASLYYKTFQELVLDENGAHAVAYLALHCRSLWKRNRPVAPTCIWYECKLLGLAICRACKSHPHNRIRLFLDVRGESDLRHASTSSLTLRHHNRDFTLKSPAWHPVTATARHWKGSIDFDILWPTGISEPMPWGGDVFFNFAKYFTSSSPLYDYQSVKLLSVPPGQSLMDFVSASGYRMTHPDTLHNALAQETAEEEAERWADLPADVAARPGWGV